MMTSLQHRIWVGLTFRGRHIVEALIIALCAGDEFVLSRIRMQRVILRTEKFIAELPFFFFITFKFVIYVIEYAFPPLAWKFRRFSRLPIDKQLQYLQSWEQSMFSFKRMMFKLVKAACVNQIMCEYKLLADLGYRECLEARTGKRVR